MSSIRTRLLSTLAVGTVALVGLAGIWFSPGAHGHDVTNPGAQINVTGIDNKTNEVIPRVPVTVKDAAGNRLYRRSTGGTGSRYMQLPATPGRYVVIAEVPEGYISYRDADAGAAVPAAAGCPDPNRCVTITVLANGKLATEQDYDTSAPWFRFDPLAETAEPVEEGSRVAAPHLLNGYMWDVTGGSRVGLVGVTLSEHLVDGSGDRTRSLGASSFSFHRWGRIELRVTPPAGFEVVGSDRRTVDMSSTVNVEFEFRRLGVEGEGSGTSVGGSDRPAHQVPAVTAPSTTTTVPAVAAPSTTTVPVVAAPSTTTVPVVAAPSTT
ncbi:MAG: hypothetical protein ACE5GB_06160, partial [Acidimicrobiales bacterium]